MQRKSSQDNAYLNILFIYYNCNSLQKSIKKNIFKLLFLMGEITSTHFMTS